MIRGLHYSPLVGSKNTPTLPKWHEICLLSGVYHGLCGACAACLCVTHQYNAPYGVLNFQHFERVEGCWSCKDGNVKMSPGRGENLLKEMVTMPGVEQSARRRAEVASHKWHESNSALTIMIRQNFACWLRQLMMAHCVHLKRHIWV